MMIKLVEPMATKTICTEEMASLQMHLPVELMEELVMLATELKETQKMWQQVIWPTTLTMSSTCNLASSNTFNLNHSNWSLTEIKIWQSVKFTEMKISKRFVRMISAQFASNVFWESTEIMM